LEIPWIFFTARKMIPIDLWLFFFCFFGGAALATAGIGNVVVIRWMVDGGRSLLAAFVVCSFSTGSNESVYLSTMKLSSVKWLFPKKKHRYSQPR
jgi:hypothetical protein